MVWSDQDLQDELTRYEAELVEAGLQALTVYTYVDQSRRFLRWRVGDYAPRDSGRLGRPTPIGAVDISALRGQLTAYADELRGAGLLPKAQATYVGQSERFLRWLGGDYVIGRASRPSTGLAPRTGVPRGVARSASATVDCPSSLRALLSQWKSRGRPEQPGLPWPRHQWLAAFPRHEDWLQAMPDRLDRRAMRGLCEEANRDATSAERAFVSVMAWGYGTVGYGPHRTSRALTETPNASVRLVGVVRTLRSEGPEAAYRRFGRKNDCRLAGLGPAFGTKFLYFCQTPNQDNVALILDDLVSRWLFRETPLDLRSTSWSDRTYRTYLRHMHAWAEELHCAPDDLEYCIFQAMSNDRGNQWRTTP